MPCSREDDVWVALGPPAALERLVPLRDEHAKRRDARLIDGGPGDTAKIARALAGRRACVLIVGDAGGRHAMASPFCETHDAEVVLGWLQLAGPELTDYVDRAVAILRRRREEKRAVALLASREDRYLALLDDLERSTAPAEALELFRWSAERIRRAPLAAALRLGASAILYTGHGAAGGWFGYGGVDAGHLTGDGRWQSHQCCALLLSLSCGAGAATTGGGQPRRGLSDEMLARGVAGAALAPLGDTLHENSRLLARALLDAMARGRDQLPDILRHARASGASLDGYAVIGDPTLGTASSNEAAAYGACVFAPPSDADNLSALRLNCDRRLRDLRRADKPRELAVT